jgi:DNA invertase Pin-like site-specific DNA recombinase
MSTERQDYSIHNQFDLIKEYAAARSIEVVKTYEDYAKSGLTFTERAGLKSLIKDVQEGEANFDAVLVYDVSRWGRFQDVDESAFYEYICRRAGIAVIYCAEPFQNDGSPLTAIMKSIKRSMAAEFSRELSKKVFAGQSRLVGLGYMVGGKAPYGLRRLLVDASGTVLRELRPGQRKFFQTDRIVLVPGPLEELNAVRLIFKLYVECGMACAIAIMWRRSTRPPRMDRRFGVAGFRPSRSSEWYARPSWGS